MKKINTEEISQIKGKCISTSFQNNQATSNFLATQAVVSGCYRLQTSAPDSQNGIIEFYSISSLL